MCPCHKESWGVSGFPQQNLWKTKYQEGHEMKNIFLTGYHLSETSIRAKQSIIQENTSNNIKNIQGHTPNYQTTVENAL